MKSTVLQKNAIYSGTIRRAGGGKSREKRSGERKRIGNIAVILQRNNSYNKNNTTISRNSQEFVPFRRDFLSGAFLNGSRPWEAVDAANFAPAGAKYPCRVLLCPSSVIRLVGDAGCHLPPGEGNSPRRYAPAPSRGGHDRLPP